MSTTTLEPVYRKDYRQPDYWITDVDLHFNLNDHETIVQSTIRFQRHSDAPEDAPLVLVGEKLELLSVAIDGNAVNETDYQVSDEELTISSVPESFELTTKVRIHPESNTTMMGLYQSSGNFCTQCEAEGFRAITYFLDRPDVMARYKTTIEADKSRYPVLLSNGNRVSEGDAEDGRHWVKWEDPFLKPSYLFALVAGDLLCHRGTFVTASNRTIDLEIWVEAQNIDACEHALVSLQKSMKWDEEKYGLEYDLDLYMIVAVGDFNMGAMENKGLNIFNTKYVLAKPDTATDDDYENVERVIAHEYFHNWTGNRVTCRDWFQLTLKEGLTVFRDQQFSADMSSPPVKRIGDVISLRTAQFAEDAGPMSHPIRPESYVEMNNFYTMTVYYKGAEVIRMYHTLVGEDGFRKGMDLYFERHDGHAVECDDFLAAMADANDVDLGQFARWYSQAGTPEVNVQTVYDEASKALEISLQQTCRQVPDLDAPLPFHIPVRTALLDATGSNVPATLEGDVSPASEWVLDFKQESQTFRFDGVSGPVTPSLFRGFSAPVKLNTEQSDHELTFLMSHETDAFNRWDAGQELSQRLLLDLVSRYQADQPLVLEDSFLEAFRSILLADDLDGSLKSMALLLPGENWLGQQMSVVDVDAIHAAREFMKHEIAANLTSDLQAVYDASVDQGAYGIEKEAIDRRRIKNTALAYLTKLGTPAAIQLALSQFENANNMTDSQAALSCLVETSGETRQSALQRFFDQWNHDPLVLDKWFSLQATSTQPDTFERVQALANHETFTLRNPNRARSLLGAFARSNQVRFHQSDGAAYEFIAGKVLELDELNPQVAAALVSSFNAWKRFDDGRQTLMKQQLERIAAKVGLSKDVGEIVSRSLS